MFHRVASPRAHSVLVLVVIAPVIAGAATVTIWGPGVWGLSVPIAVASALLVGVPVLSFGLNRGWTRLGQLVLTGAAAGALPFLIWGAAMSMTQGRLERPSSDFYLVYEPLAILTGGLSAAIYWLMFIQTRVSREVVFLTACLIITAECILVASWTSSLMRSRTRTERLSVNWSYGSAVDQHGTPEVRMWSAQNPRCVATLVMPALAAYLERDHPAQIDVELVRTTRRGSRDDLRVNHMGPVQPPPMFSGSGCFPWER